MSSVTVSERRMGSHHSMGSSERAAHLVRRHGECRPTRSVRTHGPRGCELSLFCTWTSGFLMEPRFWTGPEVCDCFCQIVLVRFGRLQICISLSLPHAAVLRSHDKWECKSRKMGLNPRPQGGLIYVPNQHIGQSS